MLYWSLCVGWTKRYQAWGYGSFAVVSAILTIHILNEKQNASFKMAWLVPVLLFPVFGTLFYVFVQLQTETKIFARRIEQVKRRIITLIRTRMSVRDWNSGAGAILISAII